MIFQLSEATAAYRRFPVYLVDATDGITPEVGEAAGQPQVSKAGAGFVNTTATLVAIGNGAYYVELTAAELNTLGLLIVRYKSANTAEFNLSAQVVAYDPYDAVRQGMTALPNAAAEAAGGLYTRGVGAGQINQQANGQIDANVERWLNVAPNALQAGRVDAYIGAIAAAIQAALVDDIWDEDIVAAHGGASAAGLLLRVLGAAISARANNPTLNALLGIPDVAATDVPSQVTDEVWDEDVVTAHGAASAAGLLLRVLGALISVRANSPTLHDLLGVPDVAAADVPAEVTDEVWDELIAAHLGVGSTGEALNNAAAAPAATWDEPLASHVTAGTTGRKLGDVPLQKFEV